MLTILSEIKFWTSREDELSVKETDFGVFKLFDHKRDTSSNAADKYYQAKRDYAERRGLVLSAKNKHTSKLKSSLKQFEDELRSKKVVFCEWNDQKTFQLMLSNGLLIYVEIDVFTGDVCRINFDKYFVGKIISENICDVVITRQHILISYNENQITFVYLQKPSLKKSLQKISAADPKIFNIIIGGQTKKVNRNLVVNLSNDLVLIWTKSSQNEFFPWRPSVKDQERANLHIYKLDRLKLEPLCYYWTENDPIGFEFSKFNENEVHSVEQKISRKGDVTIESCTYHISFSKSKLQRTSVTSIPLQTEVSCNAFSPDHEKLLMGCIDGSIVLFDEGRGLTYLVKASFIPTQVSWHPDSAVVMIANERGQIQCFDISLSCIKHQLLAEDVTPSNILDLSSFFVRQPTLTKLCWAKKPDINNHYERFAQVDGFLLLMFDTGIVANVRYVGGAGLKNDIHTSGLTADVIIHMYISLNQLEKAINVLLGLNWDTYGAMCLLSLHKIANHIFTLPSNAEREAQLQKALGSFHVPSKPLCPETEEEFGDNVDDITRRFFHYLIRYKSFEKAFSLAIDINDADLFMVLYKCTKAHGLTEIAEESMKKAEEIYAEEEESHHSTCSITSCSICSNSCDSDSDDDASSQASETHESINQPSSTPSDSNEFRAERNESPVRRLKKSLSADILNHPPLPRFPRYDVKRMQRSSTETTSSGGYIPPLPEVVADHHESNSNGIQTLKSDLSKSATTSRKKNASMSNLSSELTFQNLNKFNYTSMDEFNNNPINPLAYSNQHSVIDIVPKPSKNVPDIDQTIGIPLTFDTVDNTGNAFYPSLGPHPSLAQHYQSMNMINNNDVSNDYEYHQVPTTIHQYPLISGTIPSTSQAKLNYSTLPAPTMNIKPVPTGSILTNPSNSAANNSNNFGNKKEAGEKNKVKFSDTITVAVVPEISRKEKMGNFNERMKRKPFPGMMDPRRELAESLPLCHPNEDYLKDFSPVGDRTKEPPPNGRPGDDKKKPSIKVVHFGVV